MTLCEMLKLHYQKIKSCSNEQRDQLSQEICILQAMNTKDKSNIPDHLKYRDRGFMYFLTAVLFTSCELLITL